MTRETFAALLAPNLQAIRRFVHSRVRMSDQADDVLQQSLLHAFAHRDQLRSTDKFKSWLWSIAWNEVRMLHRERSCLSIDEFPNFELPDETPSPLAQCEEMERTKRLRAGLARLTERDRTAIRLADLNEMTAAEAARALTVSKAAFKSTHFRARKRLELALRRAA
jgi:RNA polymerase sigma factor (sigma-70 family)